MNISKKNDKIYSRPRFIIWTANGNNTKNSGNYHIKPKFYMIIVILIIAIITAIAIVKSISPIINELCVNEAKNIATKISNNEATMVMQKYTYEDFITITKDQSGNITMIQANTNTINSIASDIPVKILEDYEKDGNSTIEIYLGSILGLKIFSGTGPKIHAKIAHVGNVDTTLKSEFTSQGINQTLHRIYLEVSANVSILTPYDVISSTITNQVLIAESIIVGNVPEAYYNLNGFSSNDSAIITPIE